MKRFSTFEDVRLNDGLVYAICHEAGTLEDCVVALVNQKQALIQRIVELERIAPKKVRLEDGTVMIWRCPDELVPEQSVAPDDDGGQWIAAHTKYGSQGETGRCSRCYRCTFGPMDLGQPCGMTQPDGSRCPGVFVRL